MSIDECLDQGMSLDPNRHVTVGISDDNAPDYAHYSVRGGIRTDDLARGTDATSPSEAAPGARLPQPGPGARLIGAYSLIVRRVAAAVERTAARYSH